MSAGKHLDEYVEGWRARSQARLLRERERAQRLRARVAELVPQLVALGARKVVLFGSVARGLASEESDVDVLVEGLAPEQLMEASVLADRVVREAHVDLVPAGIARPEILARAREEGEVLYDRA